MLAALSRDLAHGRRPGRAPTSSTCHTWYTHLAGILARLAYGIPLVVTVHSLEPLRPWKREQLGGGYDVISLGRADGARDGRRGHRRQPWDARGRAAAVRRRSRCASTSSTTGSTPTSTSPIRDRMRSSGTASIRPVPYVLFVGRITRQKGIVHLVRAIRAPRPGHRRGALRRPAGHARRSPRDGARRSRAAQAERPNVVWIGEMVSREDAAPAVQPCGGVLLPIGLRAVRDHQPRGGRVRDPGGRLGGRRHPGGGGRRRDRPARAGRPAADDPMSPVDPDRFERTWPAPSTRSWPTAPRARSWAAPRAVARSSASAGRAIAAPRPSTCIGPSRRPVASLREHQPPGRVRPGT